MIRSSLLFKELLKIQESSAFKMIEDSSCWHASASLAVKMPLLPSLFPSSYVPIIVDLCDTFSQQKARTRSSKGPIPSTLFIVEAVSVRAPLAFLEF